MTIKEARARIAELENQIAPLASELTNCRVVLEAGHSRQFIEVNRITRANVEMSSGEGKPHFGMVDEFAKWLKKNSTKDWAEWNHRIHRSSDLICGRWTDSPAVIGDLP